MCERAVFFSRGREAMKERKRPLRQVAYVLALLLAIVILFRWYTDQNKERMEERNKNYALDSARIMANQIDDEFKNAEDLISTYAIYLGKSLDGPRVTLEEIAALQEDSLFDAMLFTDVNGMDHAPDGRTADASGRRFYGMGMRGEKGMTIIYDSDFVDETMACFFAPVRYKGEIIGVLRGSYLAEEYLKDMLYTTYFGEQADVYLCMPDGTVIASSKGGDYAKGLLPTLVESGMIDQETAGEAANVLKNGGRGAFVCDTDSKTDNICVNYLPEKGYVLVQTFPKVVTQRMIQGENLVGIRLETMLIALFLLYIISLLFHARRERKALEQENREMGYIIDGVNTLFSRYTMVDLGAGKYHYLAGTRPEGDIIPTDGDYALLQDYLCGRLADEEKRSELAGWLDLDAVGESLAERDDLRYECRVGSAGKLRWEHLNIICLEREDGRAAKVLIIRQDITRLKEKELRARAEVSLANRKERQYRIAITSNAIATFDFNVTKDLIEDDICREADGERVSMLAKVGLSAPCQASEWFERWKQFVEEDSMEEYSEKVNVGYLRERFEENEPQVDVEYWSHDGLGSLICVRQSFIMTRDDDTGDIMAMCVTKEITESVRRQKEQTEALQDALMQAQHANRAKTTFLSNMSHDIRTPMNAVIGFSTIALSHIDNKDQVRDALEKVLSSSNHLLNLINDILDMSRIESGKVQIREQECDLSELMHNLVNIIQPQVKAKQLNLSMDTFGVTNEEVIADSLKLNQVFINLLSNAVKYTPAGGNISFWITQKPTFRHGYGDYEFVVQDNGIGMSQEFVRHIFEPFERETSVTKSGIQGTGLGMAITKNIIEMMNGTIRVESEVGKGSTFTVCLTLRLQDTEKAKEQIRDLQGKRAMVVDDDFHTCDSVSKMLRQIGMRAEWTTSGREAVYRAKMAYEEGDPFHTYIIDWQMPETSGVETARGIRGVTGEDTPIIILTAYDWSDIEEDARKAGVTAFCAKPLFLSDLRSALLSTNSPDGEEEETKGAWTLADFSGRRVLLVEDIELNREIAEVILTEAGFEVESAPDGTDAVAMVQKSEEGYYDAILMDVQMPTMDGYEATRIIRAMNRGDVETMPIIAMTANALEEDKEAAIKNGMNAHIPKPLDMDVLISVLGQFLGQPPKQDGER